MSPQIKSKWTFESSFKITSKAMYICRTHPRIYRDNVWRVICFGLLFMNLSCVFLLFNSVFIHDLRKGNYPEACKNIAVLAIGINATIKFCLMVYYHDSIAGLLKVMDSDYELAEQFEENERNIIMSYSKRGDSVSKLWVVTAVCSSSIFPIQAFVAMAYYYWKGEPRLVPMFDLTFPYFIERYKPEFWVFCGIFALCLFFAIYSDLVYIGFEPLIPIFTLHTCGQLEVLSLRIQTVFNESNSEGEMKEKLNTIIKKLQTLYSFMGVVQNNFMILMEFSMKITTAVLPCTAFQIVEDYRQFGSFNIGIFFLLLCAIVHFLTPCYFSDILMETSEKFRQAIYSSGWENCRYGSVKKSLLFMITRAGKPFGISTVFYNISLDTFSTTCRQSYAIFNMMNAAWSFDENN